ncbi:MAG: hypothetical protein KA059_01650 [Elusimicrobiales bacterium]|jgi:hypothetical protein|nr:hypothetical protein [Elusimicrobiales bacterium]NLH40106.1 hypothetical protein [Elusimicrobiota bacterium]
MNEKRLRVLISLICFFIIIISVIFIRSPLSNSIIKNKKIKIVCLSKYPSLITYDPLTGLIDITSSTSSKKKKNTSLNQEIFEIFNRFGGELERNIPYIDLSDKAFDTEEFEKRLYNWKRRPTDIFKLIKILYSIKSNINIYDRITLITEAIHREPSQIIFSRSDIRIDDEIQSNMNKLSISVEIINSGADKNYFTEAISDLKMAGIDIIEKKNVNKREKTRVVINNIENYDRAKKIIDIIHLKDREVYLENDYMIGDVRIIFGEDYR